MLIITGMHRSGTTFLGKIFEKSGYFYYIHEPFNYVYGIEGVNCWYPYADLEKTNDNIKRLLDSLYKLEISFKKEINYSKGTFKSLIRYFIHSRGHFDFIKYKILSKLKKKDVLIKDPFLSLSAGYLANNYSDVKIIYVVRHPIAVYRSILRMNWKFDFSHILQQENLVNKYALDIIDKLNNREKSIEVEVALLWKIIHRVILDHVKKLGKEKALIIKHEEFSINPFKYVNLMFNFINKDINRKIINFIKENMFATNSKINYKKLHNFKRNAKELAYAWKKEWKPEYRTILNLTQEELTKLGYKIL